ncbi:trypsin-like serine peptidase [Pseudoruegeria sp. SHC-113]|uniref:trypsin-like serine peptidase n=1 Tax=Pseudoruegeria sp. SHC-113 TaxID=2855439 RepID=UPI0021BAE527|nr:trypsin-like serine protease [Pseudoruegeria sp. SHC-113]MCT8159272.1 trypsin-like serine protease [Pseudoruegeria sp. SHC-113]
MRFFTILLLFLLSWGGAAQAQGFGAGDAHSLRALQTADDGKGWEAVGRLNIGNRSMCTGALIADDLVLTAAHCLFDRPTGARVDISGIQFLAGWRNGRASAYRGISHAVVHPDYLFGAADGESKVRNDIALLRLDQPVRNGTIQPFAIDTRPRRGDEVGVVSYAQDRSEQPSLQEVCHVLARQSGALVLSCDVDFGSSGAPIFVMQNGIAKIVSVVSAKAEVGDQKVALGSELETPLATVMAMMEDAADPFQRARPTVRRMSLSEDRASSGAKFLRP